MFLLIGRTLTVTTGNTAYRTDGDTNTVVDSVAGAIFC